MGAQTDARMLKQALECSDPQTSENNGGEGGIRTLDTRKGITVFETGPFNHSGTSPNLDALNGDYDALQGRSIIRKFYRNCTRE